LAPVLPGTSRVLVTSQRAGRRSRPARCRRERTPCVGGTARG